MLATFAYNSLLALSVFATTALASPQPALLSQRQTASAACNNSPQLCQQTYNNITQLGAHNSPFIRDESTSFSISGNHFFNTTVQLSSGVRLVTGQVHRWSPGDSDNPSDSNLHMCHSACVLLDAGSLRGWLREIQAWMDRPENVNEVVTVLLVNADGATAAELAAEYTASGMDQYSATFTPDILTTGAWPTLDNMIQSGGRLVTFVANLDDNTAAPYLHDQFTYTFENSFQNEQPSDFNCAPDRPSQFRDAPAEALASGRLFLENHFLYRSQALFDSPDVDSVNVTNALDLAPSSLGTRISECTTLYGRKPWGVLVDFSNVGPAVASVDRANGISGAAVGRQAVGTEVRDRDFVENNGGGMTNEAGRGQLGNAALLVAAATIMVLCA